MPSERRELAPSEPLLPCPFCGGEPTADFGFHGRLGAEHTHYFVHCRNCGARTKKSASNDSACAAWNRRVALQERDADARRLDWLLRNVSGAELRRLGVVWAAYDEEAGRAALDAAMAADTQTED